MAYFYKYKNTKHFRYTMTKLIFLGNGAGQTDKQETVSFIIDNSETILFETGPSVIRQLARAGYSPTEIDAVFISHSHGDHLLGFPYFIFVDSIERPLKKKGTRNMPLITLLDIGNFLQKMIEFCYPSMVFPTKIELLEAPTDSFKTFTLSDCKITTAPVIHSVQTIGARVELPDCVIAYSSDSIYCENVIELARNCDLLIHSAFCQSANKDLAAKLMHATSMDAGKIAQKANAKNLALVDISLFVTDENILIEDAKQFFDGEVFIPKELEELEVG